MLDDNLRVLGRRVAELEIELTDIGDKLSESERMRKELQQRLGSVNEKQQKIRDEMEDEVRLQMLEKEKEIRKARDMFAEAEHKHKSEVENMKIAKQQELELIEEKIR